MTFPQFMSGWGWVLYSLLSAMFSAVLYLLAQNFNQRGSWLVFWSRMATVALLAPLLPFIALPTDPMFYAAVAGTAVCAILADVRTFDVTAKYGAGVVSRVQPLTVWGAFVLWFFLDPGLLADYAAHPGRTAVILLSLAGCVWFANHQNKCHITKAAFTEMLPALLGYSVTAVFNKYAMAHGTVANAAFGYMIVQCMLAAPLLCLRLPWKAERAVWRSRKMLYAAVSIALAWICLMVLKNYAMAYTPSPSYQSAVSLTAPLFISLYYLAIGHKEEADVRAGVGVVACAMLLAVATVH